MGRCVVHIRRRRIGLDLDGKNQLRLLKAYFTARHMFPNIRVDVLETGKGFHLKIWTVNDVDENIEVRRCLGDDADRLFVDELRRKMGLEGWIDTLFSFKRERGKVTREEPYNILSLPFWSRLPAKKKRKNM